MNINAPLWLIIVLLVVALGLWVTSWPTAIAIGIVAFIISLLVPSGSLHVGRRR